MWKILTLWRKIPKELKTTILWLVMEIVDRIKNKKKKEYDKLLHKLIDQANLNNPQKSFLKTFVSYYYNDGKITINEALDLANLLFRIIGKEVHISQDNKNWLVRVKK